MYAPGNDGSQSQDSSDPHEKRSITPTAKERGQPYLTRPEGPANV